MMFLTGWSSLRELYGDVTCIFCKGLGCRGKEFGRKSRNASSVRLAIDLDSSWLTKLMDIRKCLVVGRQRALWLLSLVVSAAEMDQQRSSHVLGHAREPRCRRGDGNGLPSASSVFGCWLEEEGNGWDCERERRERTCHLRRSNDDRQLGGNGTDANFSPTVEGLSLLFRHRFPYSRPYRFVFCLS